MKPKKFFFDDVVGEENISEDDTNSKNPNINHPKSITNRFEEDMDSLEVIDNLP